MGRRAGLLAVLVVGLACGGATAAAQGPFGPPAEVVAGTGEEAHDGNRGDGGPATDAAFDGIDGLDEGGDGAILVADEDDGRIRVIRPGGTIGTMLDDEVGRPVGVASLGWIPHEAQARHRVLTADRSEDRVVVVEPLFPAGWRPETVTDGFPASDVAAGGAIYSVDELGGTVFSSIRLEPPMAGFSTGKLAEDLDDPRGVGALPGGGALVATEGDCRIRRETSSGSTVVAGTGGCASDSLAVMTMTGPATSVPLLRPRDVAATPDGGFVMIERSYVRRVAPDGTISLLTLSGTGETAPVFTALAVTADGDVLLGLERRVLRLDTNFAPPPPPPPPPPGPVPVPPGDSGGGGDGGGDGTPGGSAGPPAVGKPAAVTLGLLGKALQVRAKRKLVLRFTASAAGPYLVEVLRKGKRVKRFTGTAKAGTTRRALALGLKPGRYELRVTLTGPDGATALATASLRVRPAAKRRR